MRKGTFNFNDFNQDVEEELKEEVKEKINDTLDKSITQLEEQLADLREQKNKLADENADLKEVLEGFKIPQSLAVEIVPTNYKQWLKWLITIILTMVYAILFNNVFSVTTPTQFVFYTINTVFIYVVVFIVVSKLRPRYKVKIKERGEE